MKKAAGPAGDHQPSELGSIDDDSVKKSERGAVSEDKQTEDADAHKGGVEVNGNIAEDCRTTSEPPEELDLGDTTSLDGDGRNRLFQRGVLFEQNSQPDKALKCYVGCLDGLTEQTHFTLLPQCLRNVADIYYRKQDYQHAIQFIQAEKLFYENALIGTAALTKRLATENGDGSTESNGSDHSDVEQVRAEEYEQLAQLCLERKQPHLALEYAGKATKIRQSVLGDNHPLTVQSLNFFASVYAEVGKQQYSDSMDKLSTDGSPTKSDQVTEEAPPADQNERPIGDVTPSSILRNRKGRHHSRPSTGQHVRFVDEDQVPQNGEPVRERLREEVIPARVALVLFLLCFVLLCFLGMFLYCHYYPRSSSYCRTVRSAVHYTYNRIKYFYFYFRSTDLNKYA